MLVGVSIEKGTKNTTQNLDEKKSGNLGTQFLVLFSAEISNSFYGLYAKNYIDGRQ